MSGLNDMAGLGKALLPEKGSKKGAAAADDDEEDDDPDFELTPELAAQLLKQSKLSQVIGSSSGFVESLPKSVRRRVGALQDLQSTHDELEEEYKKERAALDAKYRALYEPLYEKRSAIVTGAEEAPPKADAEESDEPEAEEKEGGDEGADVKGIPDFWLCVMRNHEVTEEQITEKDAEALKFLRDVKWEQLSGEEEKGFRLYFYFDSNPFFDNEVLTKTYHMIDEEDPILEHAEGTEITWKSGKNLTVKVMKKKPKKGSKQTGKVLTKTEPCESFFNFFSPPKIPDEGEELEEEEMEQLQEVMEADYEIGVSIKEKLIPHAVSWFTGEALQMDDDDMDDEDDDEDDEEDDDEEGAEGDAPKGLQDTADKPPECKQQ